MEERDTRQGRRSPDDVGGSIPDISVLYVDSDTDAWAALVSFVDTIDDIAIERITDADVARDRLEQGGFDVVVVESDALAGPNDPLLADAVPSILYTDRDPWAIADSILGATDSLVEKSASGSTRYLVEKIRGVVADRTERDSLSLDALETLSDDLDDDAGVFLIDDGGEILWSNDATESLFPTGATDDWVAGTGDFETQISGLLSDQPKTLSTVLGHRNGDETGATHLLEVDGEDERIQYLHASCPVDIPEPGSRLEMFVPLPTVVSQYERLELFEELVDNADDGLFVLDADGRIEYCNQSYAEMLGHDTDELVGEHASTVMAEGELEDGHEALNRSLESDDESGVADLTLVHEDGTKVHTSIHGSVRRDSTGSYAGVMGVVRDITERKERERELEEYRTLVENAVDPMYVLDENGLIQIVNQAMADFVGREKDRLVGADVDEVLPAKSLDAGRESLRHILSNDGVSADSYEMWMTSADGEERFFEVTVSVITENGEFVGSVATFRDITERHRRQEQLDLRKQIFARSLRHNIRNETSVIHSYGTILADELDGEQAEMAEAILTASESLANTSRKVSQFDWLAEKDTELVDHDLHPLVKRCIEQVQATSDAANVTVDVPDDVRIRAVRDLDVAIRNLVENALQHGGDSGPPEVSVTARRDGDRVSLTVADDGPGIPTEEIAVIEEGEETALNHASGLGLWLVKRIVTQSGGSLSFDTDDGTSAELSFPRADDAE